MITFNSALQTSYLHQGQIRNDELIEIVRNATGINCKIVTATRHMIISGAPGVGKTWTTIAELEANNIPYVLITSGMTDIEIVSRLSDAMYKLTEDQELVIVVDDADDVIFASLSTLNRWKIATNDLNPYWSYPKEILGTINKAEKAGKKDLVKALKKFQTDSGLGVDIPLDRARVLVLCNTDLEDPKQLSKKLFNSVNAVLDRFEYERLNMPWQEKWGWLAYVLSNSQPFPNVTLTDDQKKEVLTFLYSNWKHLKSADGASYRFVRKLIDDMVNNPGNYIDRWSRRLRNA